MQTVAPVVRTTLISCVYDPTGLANVMLFDNSVLAWLVDETGVLPVVPVILGTLAPTAPATAPIFSPQWAARNGHEFMIPDIARGSPGDLFTFLSTNNGANRPIYANFTDVGLINDFNTWARAHPTLHLKDVPVW
jgi:hypothetical protein